VKRKEHFQPGRISGLRAKMIEGGVYPPSLGRKLSGNGMKKKEIDGISDGSATELQRDDNGA